MIVVERADMPVSMQVQPSILQLSGGHKGYLRVTGVFSDGATVDLTKSSRIAYSSNMPAVATVQAQGIVTAEGPPSKPPRSSSSSLRQPACLLPQSHGPSVRLVGASTAPGCTLRLPRYPRSKPSQLLLQTRPSTLSSRRPPSLSFLPCR